MKRVNLELSDELLARVDEAAGMIPRNRWLRSVIERAVIHMEHAGTPEPVSLEEARAYGQHVPGPNVENVRSSSQAKRNTQPYPKKGKST